LHGLLVIGEAVSKLPRSITEREGRVDWRRISAMRNLIVHEYFGVDLNIVWQAATQKLPELRRECVQILNDFEAD
jgi:uncharacterized protein with HEPN domain